MENTIKREVVRKDNNGEDFVRVINSKAVEFFCEHCYEMKRKVYYEEGGEFGVCWCKECADTRISDFEYMEKKLRK